MSQQELELPQGWAETILEDIAIRLQAGGTPSTKNSRYYENGIIPFVKIDDITDSNSKYLTTTKVKITNQGLDDSSAWLVSENSLLYSMYASYGLPIINKIKVATSQAIIVYQQPKDLISLEFVYYFLKFMGPFSTTKGTTQKNLNAGIIRNYKILLPPLNEQKRIVSKIEELFSKIDSTKQSLEQTKLQLEQYRQSLLKSAFEGKLTKKWRKENYTNLESAHDLIKRIQIKDNEPILENLPETWALTSIGALFHVKPGSTPSRKNTAYWNGNISWVSSGEVRNHNIIETKENISEEGLQNSSAMLHPPETVLLAMIGEGKTRGRVSILKISATTNQNIAAILCANSEILSPYIFFWFLKRYDETRNVGSGGMQKALSTERVKDLPFVLAPIQEQKEIVSQIEQGFSLIENTSQIVESTLQKLQTMKMSILKRAFEGKLVPQDPKDEPSSVLLERIKAEKS